MSAPRSKGSTASRARGNAPARQLLYILQLQGTAPLGIAIQEGSRTTHLSTAQSMMLLYLLHVADALSTLHAKPGQATL